MKINVLEVIGKEAYFIKERQLSEYSDIYIDGVKVENEAKKYAITINKNSVIKTMPNSKTLLGYERGGEFLTIEDFKAKPTFYDECSSEEDVLRAIANRKELEGFKPKYKELELENVEVNVYGFIEDTKSNFIKCGMTSIYSEKPCIYTINVNDITIDEYKKISQEFSSHARFEKTDRRYIRFVKINSSFAFGDCYPFCEISSEKIFLSLAEAKTEEANIRKATRNKAMNVIFPKKMDEMKKLMIISNLKAIKKAKTKATMDEMIQVLIADIQDYSKEISF